MSFEVQFLDESVLYAGVNSQVQAYFHPFNRLNHRMAAFSGTVQTVFVSRKMCFDGPNLLETFQNLLSHLSLVLRETNWKKRSCGR